MNAYGHDSRRRRRARRAGYWRAAWLQFRVSLVFLLVALAVGTIAYDHLAHPGALTPPVHGHAIEVTTTLPPPDPATTGGHP